MKWLVDPDSPFYNLINFFADIIIFSFLCFLFSLPLITIGTAHTATYYIAKNRIADKKANIKDFFMAFIKNFIPATLIWICILVISLALIIFYLNFSHVYFLLPIIFFVCLELIFFCIYIFPVIATKKENKIINLVKLSFFLAHKYIFTTFLCLLLAIILFITCFFYPPLFLISNGLYNFFVCRKISQTIDNI